MADSRWGDKSPPFIPRRYRAFPVLRQWQREARDNAALSCTMLVLFYFVLGVPKTNTSDTWIRIIPEQKLRLYLYPKTLPLAIESYNCAARQPDEDSGKKSQILFSCCKAPHSVGLFGRRKKYCSTYLPVLNSSLSLPKWMPVLFSEDYTEFNYVFNT